MSLFTTASFAKERKAVKNKPLRNLPEISASSEGTLSFDQEINFFSSVGIANTSLDYGLSDGWDVGIGLLNAQFFTQSPAAAVFQPDLLTSMEKHWPIARGQLLAGSQFGLGVTAQSPIFLDYSYIEFQRSLAGLDTDLDLGGYYANSGVAGIDSLGFHVNLETPLLDKLRLNADYLSGQNGIGSTTVECLYPLRKDWRIGLGVQLPNVYTGDHYIGMLGFYWH